MQLPHAELMSRFGLNRNWEESPIRFLSWHRQANKFALALRDDTIKIYYCNKYVHFNCFAGGAHSTVNIVVLWENFLLL